MMTSGNSYDPERKTSVLANMTKALAVPLSAAAGVESGDDNKDGDQLVVRR